MTCIHCHQQCRSIDCFNRHKEIGGGKKRISPCNALWRCTICLQTIKVSDRSPTQHRCSEYKCSLCHLFVLPDHCCYMRSLKNNNGNVNYIHFDFECTKNEITCCDQGYQPLPCQNCNRFECGTLNSDGQKQDCDFGYRPLCGNCKSSSCGRPGHTPNYVVAHTTCAHCMGTENVDGDTKCGLKFLTIICG